MELLGPSLGDTVKEKGRLALEHVLQIADQMISSLEHIHGLGIVHYDVKPENILLCIDQPSIICLVDFGISRQCLVGTPEICEPSIEHNYVIGMLSYASLNSHDGIDLNPRDDLESLSYTLLFLLKGTLPWQSYSQHGTILGQISQVREQKKRWTGSKLAKNCPQEFGWLVDYSRRLKFIACINYRQVRAWFSGVAQKCKITPEPEDRTSPRDPQYPVKVGQLVSIQVLSRTSIEGHSLQGLADLWHDPFLSSNQFVTSPHPAIVIATSFDRITSLFMVQVVSVGQGTVVQSAIPAKGVSGYIALSSYHSQPSDRGETIVIQPGWPMPDTYCYTFPRAPWFYCVPDQTSTYAHWKVDDDNIEVLRRNFAKPFPMSFSLAPIADPVLRYEERMVMQDTKIFVTLATIGPSQLESKLIDWRGDRGFFDESIAVGRWRGLQDGYLNWTGVSDRPGLEDSYDGDDYSMFNSPQQERAQNLTLSCPDTSLGADQLGLIVQVK